MVDSWLIVDLCICHLLSKYQSSVELMTNIATNILTDVTVETPYKIRDPHSVGSFCMKFERYDTHPFHSPCPNFKHGVALRATLIKGEGGRGGKCNMMESLLKPK